MQTRIIPFRTIEVMLRYSALVHSLAGAKVMFVLPNAVVLEYNEQIIFAVSRDEEGG